jgi:hypothetical protein
MRWKAEVRVVNDENWHGNGKVFDTKKDAENYARDLCARWTLTTGWRVVRA